VQIDKKVKHKRIKKRRRRGLRSRLEGFHYERLIEGGCIICRRPAEVHHSIIHNPRRNDRIFPLCPDHHRNTDDSVHGNGNEREFFAGHGIDAETWPKMAWIKTMRLFDDNA